MIEMVVYPIIYRVLCIPGGFLARFLNHQQFFLRYKEVSTTEYIHHLLVLALLGLYAPLRIWRWFFFEGIAGMVLVFA